MSFPRYAEYKDSGVEWLGEVPAHWEVVRAKAVFKEIDDRSCDGDEELLTVSHLTGVTPRSEKNVNMIMAESLDGYKKCAPGDLVINTMWAWMGALGTSRTHGIVSPSYNVYRPYPGQIFPRYFDHLCRIPVFATVMKALSTGVWESRLRLYPEAFFSIRFALPSLPEQTAIAAFLDRQTAKIDALVAEQEKLIALLAEKRQAVISHAVTKGLNPAVPMKDSGIEWLGEVPEHWDVVRIKYLTEIIEQGWSPQCEGFPVETPDEWGVLKVGCVNGGTFNPQENKTLPVELEPVLSLGIVADDLLISRANTRELVGGAAVALEDHPRLMLCDKLYRLRLDRSSCLPKFLSRFLGIGLARGQIELAATGASSSMVNIGQGTILEMAVPLPPISEQSAIVGNIQAETTKFDALTAEARRV